MKLSEAFLKTLDDAASKEETSVLFKKLTDFVKQVKLKLEEAFSTFKGEVNDRIAAIEAKISEASQAVTKRQDEDKETMYSESRTLQRLLDQKEADIRSAIPAPTDLTPLSTRIDEVEKRIPTLPEAPTPEGVRDMLETLEGKERLNVSAIDGLEDLIDRVATVEKRPTVMQGGIMGRDLFKDIDLSSQLDGVTKTFNLPSVYNIISVNLSSFPHALRKNIDFTYTSNTITFTSEIDAAVSLATGQTCVLTVVSG